MLEFIRSYICGLSHFHHKMKKEKKEKVLDLQFLTTPAIILDLSLKKSTFWKDGIFSQTVHHNLLMRAKDRNTIYNQVMPTGKYHDIVLI